MRWSTFLLKYGEPWFAVALLALLGGTLIWIGLAEDFDQQANRRACPGRYVQVGDKRDSGLCIRPDAVIWER